MKAGVHCKVAECADTKLWVADVLELDFLELAQAKKPELTKLKKTLEQRGQSLTLLVGTELYGDLESSDEQWLLLAELVVEHAVEAVVVVLNKTFLKNKKSVAALKQRFTAFSAVAPGVSLFIDVGQEQLPLMQVGVVLDPLVSEEYESSTYWRVSEGYEKLVGSADLKLLARAVRIHFPSWVILAHAGRFEEISPLKERLL